MAASGGFHHRYFHRKVPEHSWSGSPAVSIQLEQQTNTKSGIYSWCYLDYETGSNENVAENIEESSTVPHIDLSFVFDDAQPSSASTLTAKYPTPAPSPPISNIAGSWSRVAPPTLQQLSWTGGSQHHPPKQYLNPHVQTTPVIPKYFPQQSTWGRPSASTRQSHSPAHQPHFLPFSDLIQSIPELNHHISQAHVTHFMKHVLPSSSLPLQLAILESKYSGMRSLAVDMHGYILLKQQFKTAVLHGAYPNMKAGILKDPVPDGSWMLVKLEYVLTGDQYRALQGLVDGHNKLLGKNNYKQ